MTIHIAILDTDVPVPTVYAARGLYSSQFRALLQSAAGRVSQSTSQNVKIQTSAYDVVGGTFPALSTLRTTKSSADEEEEEGVKPIDAILITGSAASAYYTSPQYAWIGQLQTFIRKAWTDYPAVKMFGSCFGHQIIAQALLLDSDEHVQVEACAMGYEVGIHPITLNPAFSATKLGGVLSSGLESRDGMLRVQLIHGDRVVSTTTAAAADLPAPWLNIGSTQLSPIQGMYYPGRVLTYQGHFEFDVFVNTETVLEFGRRGGWDAGVVGQYLEQVTSITSEGGDDSELAAELVVRFLVDDEEESMDVKVESGLATPPEEVDMT
jgi:GMP synthase-like glutamine amidotransferase